MDRERRRQIAAIADRYDVTVIEDDICGLMPERPIAPIASLISGAYFLPNRGVQMSQRWRASGLHRCAEWYGRGSYHSCSGDHLDRVPTGCGPGNELG